LNFLNTGDIPTLPEHTTIISHFICTTSTCTNYPHRTRNKPTKYILKHNQQDATLYSILCCCQCSTI